MRVGFEGGPIARATIALTSLSTTHSVFVPPPSNPKTQFMRKAYAKMRLWECRGGFKFRKRGVNWRIPARRSRNGNRMQGNSGRDRRHARKAQTERAWVNRPGKRGRGVLRPRSEPLALTRRRPIIDVN